ncbi:lasso RiPP family leader peptide-containing protein [Salinarimonas ramus]|uniref:Lasso peptide n=1 Tax=Salinarimonas ramus TaxID=690164 RepID=A0A917QA14_9HYPH|nr:lasso RiPP family leader peptide-containing protein [Salinarimonas ramus]GGK37728.1 hypothetical protein GCM10011322_25950 [Salinarimonas ramus]
MQNVFMKADTEKLAYETPELEVMGTLEEITHGNSTGSNLDADFQSGASFDDLTFS